MTKNWLAIASSYLAMALFPAPSLLSQERSPITNLALATGESWSFEISDRWLVFAVWEKDEGRDLNGDGDFGFDHDANRVVDYIEGDKVVHVHDLVSGLTRNLALDASSYRVSGRWLALTVRENRNTDLNEDGDTEDDVVHVHHLETSQTVNLQLATRENVDGGEADFFVAASERWLAFGVRESAQGQDLNGDGDVDDDVLHVHEFETGETRNLRLVPEQSYSVRLSRRWLVFAASETGSKDLNGDGDMNGDRVVHVYDIETDSLRNLRLAGASQDIAPFVVADSTVAILVYEVAQDDDLSDDELLDTLVLHFHDLETGRTTATNFPIDHHWDVRAMDTWVAFPVEESAQLTDLNGDGDDTDRVLHVVDVRTGSVRNLGLATDWFPSPMLSENRIVFAAVESAQGETDLNTDGDTDDVVWHLHDFETGETRNLQITFAELTQFSGSWLVFRGDGNLHVHDLQRGESKDLGLAVSWPPQLSGRWLSFQVDESEQREDLNGDRDRRDMVVHVHDLSTGETTNLGLARVGPPALDEDHLALAVTEESPTRDLNGDGDTRDSVLHVVDLNLLAALPRFRRGDANADGEIDVGDAVSILAWLFASGESPACLDAADSDDDGVVNLSDSVSVLQFLFSGGAAPPLPGPARCGPDLSQDSLTCLRFAPCP